MAHVAKTNRYNTMKYNRCGNSGLQLPAVSLGLWHNFGGVDRYENSLKMILRSFDLGITHFDLANNYGPPPGSAEKTFGRILKEELGDYRDELVISTKAGYLMWPGPYGEWGSRKYLMASLDQSLMRMGLDYVDIFYSHRPDPETPMEETMTALADAVRQGKALYVGISSYTPEQTRRAVKILKDLGCRCLIHQPKYSMLQRQPEEGLLSTIKDEGIGCIAFCPLAQGLLTEKYVAGIPDDSRAAKPHGYLKKDAVTDDVVGKVKKLGELANDRMQSLAQMSLAWVLRRSEITSVLIGASRVEQIEQNVATLDNLEFTKDELDRIDSILGQ